MKKQFVNLVTEPILINVMNKRHIEKGEVIKIRGFYFVALHEKIAYDGTTKLAVWLIGCSIKKRKRERK